MSKVVTRFAPSPTGYLHIGGGRTALFNWLFARHHGGTFLLRIEDTDRARSTQAAVDALLDGLDWLGLHWDGDTVFQFARMDRHAEVAHQMVADGTAYYCYCTPEELDDMRKDQVAHGKPQQYDGRCRHRTAPRDGVKPVVRIKAPRPASTSPDPEGAESNMLIHDIVHGDIWVPYAQLDDMILLRSDGTPTYMLSVVVDDHDMGITHIIRGDDHITNAFRQRMIYDAMGWDVPAFVHIPLIHGPDGAKLSKRHGAVGLEAYRDMGYLPEAMRNYLLRLGWGHGDTDIISTEDAIKIFRLEDIGKSPSRMDFTKLSHVNAHYMRQCDDARLLGLTLPFVEKALGHAPDAGGVARFKAGLGGLKERASTLVELAEAGLFYLRQRPLPLDEKAGQTLDADARATLRDVSATLQTVEPFDAGAIETALKAFAEQKGLKLGKVAMPLRCAITGSTNSPSVFHVAEILGREETLARIGDVT